MYINESDVFTAEVPEPFDVSERWKNKTFRAQNYSFSGDSWRVSGIYVNQDGSLHKGGNGSYRDISHDEVPEDIRKQAEAFFNDLADHLQAKYRAVALTTLNEDHLTEEGERIHL
jgi:hypothetical protein